MNIRSAFNDMSIACCTHFSVKLFKRLFYLYFAYLSKNGK